MYINYMTQTETNDINEVVDANILPGRFYIRMGFAGFNSRANNAHGYDTAEKAAAAVRRYQSK